MTNHRPHRRVGGADTTGESRLAALARCEVVDTPPEEALDRIATLAATIFDAPIALVSLVDRDRQWFRACYGLEMGETGRFLASAVAAS